MTTTPLQEVETCPNSGRPAEKCTLPCHLCPQSDLKPGECAHCRGDQLPHGVVPAEEPVRGVEPSGDRVWPLSKDVARLADVALLVQVDRLGHRTHAFIGQSRRRRPKSNEHCRWVPDVGDWCTAEHVRDCTSNACQGCKPCDKGHCGHRGTCANHVKNVGQRTCPQCIGTVRADIADIVDMTVLVSAELEYAGVEEGAQHGKGTPDVTEPANISGPAASPEQLDGRRRYDEQRGWCDYPMRAEVYGLEAHHPYSVLARWEMFFRSTSNAPQPKTFTSVTSAAAYLTGLLATRMPHEDVEHTFDPFARDIARCRVHLEGVLSNSRRPELGVPCPKCVDAIAASPPEPGQRARHAGQLVKHHDNSDRTGANDVWICPDVPTHRWRDGEYRLRVASEYLSHADALTAEHMRKQYGITAGNLRKWAERGHVRKHGRDGHGRMLYDVRDARQREDLARGHCDYPRLPDVYPPTDDTEGQTA